MSSHLDVRNSRTQMDQLEPQIQPNGQGASSAVDVPQPPQVRRLTIDDLREELKPILSRSEAANLC
jgi:hypothetical protein